MIMPIKRPGRTARPTVSTGLFCGFETDADGIRFPRSMSAPARANREVSGATRLYGFVLKFPARSVEKVNQRGSD